MRAVGAVAGAGFAGSGVGVEEVSIGAEGAGGVDGDLASDADWLADGPRKVILVQADLALVLAYTLFAPSAAGDALSRGHHEVVAIETGIAALHCAGLTARRTRLARPSIGPEPIRTLLTAGSVRAFRTVLYTVNAI